MKLTGSLVALVASAALIFGTDAFTQETKPADGETKSSVKAGVKTTAAKENEKPKGRLPANFAKLELSQAQREKIYGIQASYEPRIDDLAQQIKDLMAERETDVEAVLTAEQKKKLTEFRTAAKAKAETRKKELEAKKTGEKAVEKTDGEKGANKE